MAHSEEYGRPAGEGLREVVTYCASGYRAARTYVVLRALGYPGVRNYAASWNEWGWHADLPVDIDGRVFEAGGR